MGATLVHIYGGYLKGGFTILLNGTVTIADLTDCISMTSHSVSTMLLPVGTKLEAEVVHRAAPIAD